MPSRLPQAPPDTRIYAIGDIHGCSGLLDRLHALIRDDAEQAPETRRVVVYLGDYVDRGPDSRGVLDRLIDGPGPGFERVFLKGNHEDMMVRFLAGEDVGPMWLHNGGGETLASYGLSKALARFGVWLPDLEPVRRSLADAVPAAHRTFLESLAPSHVEGDYAFVHAGLRPGVALTAQVEADLLWIRQPFLDSDADYGYIVVHGHTPYRIPELRPNRINLDTGAVYWGHLTAMAFHGDRQELLQT